MIEFQDIIIGGIFSSFLHNCKEFYHWYSMEIHFRPLGLAFGALSYAICFIASAGSVFYQHRKHPMRMEITCSFLPYYIFGAMIVAGVFTTRWYYTIYSYQIIRYGQPVYSDDYYSMFQIPKPDLENRKSSKP